MKRDYKGRAAQVVTAVLAAIILFHLLYVSHSLDRVALALHWRWLMIYQEAFLPLHVGLMTTIAFLLYAATKKSPSDRLPWYDLSLLILGLGSNVYFLVFYEEVLNHFVRGITTPIELILGLIVILTMVEAGRRAIGIWMPLLALLAFAYPLIGQFLPGFLHTRAYSLGEVTRHAGPSMGGMYGSMTNLGATVVVAFLFFAQVMQATKASDFFTNMALGLFGRLSGGPALASVAASAAFGSVAAGASANAVATGSITIPLMKRTGMKSSFAAAVASVAANGGAILPPVMATNAFIMADVLGITYWDVVVAAFVPGILYYFAIGIAVYIVARRLGIKGLPRQELPSMKKSLAGGWQFVLPIAVLLWFLGYLRYSAQMSAIYASLAFIAVSMFRKDTRLGWRKLVNALAATGRVLIFIVPLFTLAGVMVGGLEFTGLSMRLSGGLIDLSGGSALTLVILAAMVAIVLGMPLSDTAVYILLITLVAPAIIKLGVNPIAAHLFLIWFAATGPITPPTCSVCFVTAGIAGENVDAFGVGWTSMRLAAVAYILPFTYIYSPALLMMGGPLQIAVAVVTAVLGVTLLAAGMQGWLISNMNFFTRGILIITGIMFIWPGWMADSIALALATPVVAYQLWLGRRRSQQPC